MIKVPTRPPGLLEKFGLYYLGRFSIRQPHHHPFDQTDDELVLKVRKISRKGIFLSAVVGILTVFPIVWLDVHFANAGFWTHYCILAAAILGFTLIEFYLLFLISLKAVHEVSAIINMQAREKDYLDGLFGVKNILARTALEIPDPELTILGIDPFQRISKKNLFILSLVYKGKIILSNLVIKLILTLTTGPTLLGIPIAWEALLVEAFWNGVVIKRVVMEARLRLFGYALAEEITETVINEGTIFQLSPEARIGCLRSIGNAVVMTQNYHPNMIILLLHFADLLRISEENKYDDWNLFLETLAKLPDNERFFLLDLFTVAAAFDGKLSKLEQENLRAAYQKEYDLYLPRLQKLTQCLKGGRLNEAYALCRLDYVAG
ncbi:MAG: hypothetical protein WBP58_01470 [Chitinophagaceae bacterium]